MNGPPAAPAAARPKRSWLRRWSRRFGLLVLTLLLLALGAVIWHRTIGARRLEAAIAAADRQGPGWQWEELSAYRAAVPDKENAAPVVVEVGRLLPEKWPPEPPPPQLLEPEQKSVLQRIKDTRPMEQLAPDLVEEVRAELRKVAPAVPVAHRLEGYRTGRYPDLSFEEYHLRGDVPHLRQCMAVASLLRVEAALRTEEGRARDALACARCLLSAGDSVGDEPGALAQLVRLSSREGAVQSIERTLGQTQPAEEDLAATQKRLQEGGGQNTLAMALRGDRAFFHRLMTWVDTSDVEKLGEAVRGYEPLSTSRNHPWLTSFCNWFIVGWFKENHAVLLELANEAVEIAKLPADEQAERFTRLERKRRILRADAWPAGLRYAVGANAAYGMIKVAEAFSRSRAAVRCAVVALAAERFRLAQGRWPQRLDELVPRFLPAVPTDPYDRQPLKLRRFRDGIVVYSVGPDGKDDAGAVGPRPGPTAAMTWGSGWPT